MVLWLEDYLRAFSGALVMVTHDRYFLERRHEPDGWRWGAAGSTLTEGNYDEYPGAKAAPGGDASGPASASGSPSCGGSTSG